METAATTTAPVDNSNVAAVLHVVDNISVQPSTSYNTHNVDSCSNQSVQSAITPGTTHPHSPVRTAITPLSLSPASAHTNNTNTNNTSSNNTSQQQIRSDPVSDDDMTEPTTATTGGVSTGYTRSDNNTAATSTFGKLIKNATKTMNNRTVGTGTNRKDSADEEDIIAGVLIYGYLQKLNRNGKWQTRWFETDGECLTYFKSSKRTKQLASLDLSKVGSIVIDHGDEKGCCFTINISKRPYHLRADSKAAMKDWVITLNRVKEARMQEGNVKLVMPKDLQNNHRPNQSVDLLDSDISNTPRVVVVANRQRTHAVEDDEFHSWEGGMDENNPYKDMNILSSSTSTPIARWQKANTSINQIASKVLRWARSIRKLGCAADAANQVVIMNPDYSNGPYTEPSTGTSKSINHSLKNTVITGDLLNTGVVSINQSAPTNQNTTTTNQVSAEDDDDDDNDARFLS
ncbi:hypothetical protein FRACYDRAFT_261737 [Fragilariopsis cylindrus CCMP1102]|uniref:PH domain-containing protein n=1 Tax=Fragilariopsis cylindrus CCMP1102 TaxID=635003 RepID=A0A1E7FBJ7_9STRA|nr:hypothetical protein FRACYDRAFT_261737 [Fragilariopsis cylindrus CCMP1102]|eukprot:OEU15540.1 hypothetical protein FRACYDRAFT_261737 [Fragilariopsis cylindrus CCMP1102]